MLNEIWVTVFTLIKSIVGDVDVKNKGTLQKQIDDCFTSASNGKELVANAVTGKGVPTSKSDSFATMAANIGNIKTSPRLQAKNAALSTTTQTIKPDTGYDGLSQVSVPAVSGTAGTGDVLAGKTFSSGSAGISKTGTIPNKGAWTGTVAAASRTTIPAGFHNGSGYVQCSDKGYNQGVIDADNRVNANSANYKGGYNAGVSAADGRVNINSANYKGGYNAGMSAADGRINTDSANYKGGYNAGVSATKKGTAGAGDVLSGKTFTNSSSVNASGTMPNKGNTTQDAGATTQDDTYTYLSIPANGFYNTNSKIRTKNSNLGQKLQVPNCFWLSVTGFGNSGNGTAVTGTGGIWLDITNVNKLSFSDISVSGSPSTHSIDLRPKYEGHSSNAETAVRSVTINNGSTAELDVSDLTGVYYLVIIVSAKPSSGYKTYKASAKCTVS